MDTAKAQVLRDIGYRINSICGNCSYGVFARYDWGTCSKHSYKHGKHTKKSRPLSIHISGGCPWFELKEGKEKELHGFAEFL